MLYNRIMLLLHKPVGLTSLQTIEKFRHFRPEYKHAKLGYAGRLDPMAEGLLLILVEDENKNREPFLNLDKKYEFDMLFGLQTDTYDILGLFTKQPETTENVKIPWENFFNKYTGSLTQEYPPYSVKGVEGKSLFTWAREGRLNEIKIPEKLIEIYNLNLIKEFTISAVDLVDYAKERIENVDGDFRQEQILQQWYEFGQEYKNKKFSAATLNIYCSSGTYVRTLIDNMGTDLNLGAIALRIKRTHVGNFALKNAQIF